MTLQVADLVAVLRADVSQYTAAMAKAEGQTVAAGGSIGGSFDKAKIAAVAFAGVAAFEILKFTDSSIKAAESHEAALNRLSVAAKGNTDAFAAMAAQQSNLTGFTQDSIIGAEQFLARLNLTQKEMSTLLPLTEDYARALGIDLPTAGRLIDQAFLGNARALKALGINFKATGDEAKDFQTIVADLSAKVGGQAVAFLTTAAGRSALLAAQVNNLKIAIGDNLMPVVEAVVTGMGHLVAFLTPAAPIIVAIGAAFGTWLTIRAVIAGIAFLGKSLGFIAPAASAATAAQAVQTEATQTQAGAIAELVAAIQVLIGAQTELEASTIALSASQMRGAVALGAEGAAAGVGAAEAGAGAAAGGVGGFAAVAAAANPITLALAAGVGLLTINMEQNQKDAIQTAQAIKTWADQLRDGTVTIGDFRQALKDQNIPNWARPQLWDDFHAAVQAAGTPLHIIAAETKEAFNIVQEAGAPAIADLKLMGTTVTDFANAASAAYEKAKTKASEWTSFTQKTLSTAKAAFANWSASASGNLNAIDQSLSTLEGQAHLTASGILASFKNELQQTIAYGKNLEVIAKTGGQAGKDLANQLLQTGQAGEQMAYVIASANAKTRDAIVKTFGTTQSAADHAAHSLQKTIVGVLDDIRTLLNEIASHWNLPPLKTKDDVTPKLNGIASKQEQLQRQLAKGLGPIKADPGPALDAFHMVGNKYGGLSQLVAGNPLTVSADVNPAIAAVGGLVNYMHAHGLIQTAGGWTAVITVTEGHGPTPPKGPAAASIPSASSSSFYTPPSSGGGGGGGSSTPPPPIEQLNASVSAIRGWAATLSQAADRALIPAAKDAGQKTLLAFAAGMAAEASHLHDQIGNTITALQSAVKQAIDNAKAKNQELSDSFKALRSDVIPALGEVEHAVQRIGDHLAKLKEQLAAFKQNIVAGFDTLKDLGGTVTTAWSDYQQQLADYQTQLKQFTIDQAAYQSSFDTSGNPTGTAPVAPILPTAPNFSTIIAQQVADAQRLAKDLTDAATAGLNKGLLQQFAGQGVAGANALEQLLKNPALIAQLNQAATDISKAAGDTADALGDQFFGESIKKAGNQLDRLSDRLDHFIGLLRDKLTDGTKDVSKALNALANTLGALSGLSFPGGGGGGGGNGGGNGDGGSGNPWDHWNTWAGGGSQWNPPADTGGAGGSGGAGGAGDTGDSGTRGTTPPISAEAAAQAEQNATARLQILVTKQLVETIKRLIDAESRGLSGATINVSGVEDLPSLLRKLQEATQKDARVNAGAGGFTTKR